MQKLFITATGKEVKVNDRINTKYWREVDIIKIEPPTEENPTGYVNILFDTMHTMRTTPLSIQCAWEPVPVQANSNSKTIFMVSVPIVMELSHQDEIKEVLRHFLQSARHDSIVSFSTEAGVISTGLTKEEFFK